MSVIRQTELLRRQNQELSAEFIEIELDLGITFCEIALSADRKSKIQRNMDQARRAYESARKFAGRIKRNGEIVHARIDKKLKRLATLLVKSEITLLS
jgi:hypothetical protein